MQYRGDFSLLTGYIKGRINFTILKIVNIMKKLSQICSQCNELVPKELKDRTHSCPYCGLILDRDHNAAINIHRLGMEKYGTGTVLCKPT